ncbi:major facilitator superfamily domain-containing protein 6 [Trichonephila inaurata madagascariensis]|uniref:Major facilitator superfamily domain-containing protein 6 n=1 Tax=Trichonephila inaurata madagascariensis TaxID=2747483 RepID=A0A8X6YXY2_9ARAC|nr:major facilitator superfamily domain-containing protein 6 [Trichonephila inaurata madagascariensis]
MILSYSVVVELRRSSRKCKERLRTTPDIKSPPSPLGASFPYITIFAKNRVGISATALAAILTTQQFLFIFTKPLIGYIADYFNKLKFIIGILAVIQTIFFFLLLTIPKIQKEQKTEIFHNETALKSVFDYFNSSELLVKCEFHQQKDIFSEKDNLSYNNSKNNDMCFLPFDILSEFSDLCSNYTTERKKPLSVDSSNLNDRNSTETSPINFGQQINYATTSKPLCTICCKVTGNCQDIQCEALKNDSNRVLIEKVDINYFKTYQFWLFAFLTTIGMMSANAMITLSDTACCDSVQKFGTDFGRQRLWGAIGWGLMSPVGGLINDYTDDYFASWTLMAIMSVVALFNIRRLDLVKPQFSQNILKDVGLVLSSGEFLAFKTGVLMCGIGTGVTWFYLIWFLTTIGGSRFLCGMVQFVQCFVGEIPFMFYSGWMLKKIGHFNVLSLALMSYCIRFFWYSQLYNPWLVLPTECLDGFTYGLFYVAVASRAHSIAVNSLILVFDSFEWGHQRTASYGLAILIIPITWRVLLPSRVWTFISTLSPTYCPHAPDSDDKIRDWMFQKLSIQGDYHQRKCQEVVEFHCLNRCSVELLELQRKGNFTVKHDGPLENGKEMDIYTVSSDSADLKPLKPKHKFWHIDREMLGFKIHFFMIVGALGTSLPYITIFAKNRVGISATALAAILTTQQFLFIFTKPLIGYIADYFNKLKFIIGILAVIQTIFFFLLLTIPKIQKEQKTEIFHNETALKSVFDYFNSSELLVKCEFHQQNDIFSEKGYLVVQQQQKQRYVFFFVRYFVRIF